MYEPNNIDALSYLVAAGGLLIQCCLPVGIILVIIVLNMNALNRNKEDLAELADRAPRMPPEFRHRCPMCGNDDLDWGIQYRSGFFAYRYLNSFSVAYNRRARRRATRRIAARCSRCDYILEFDRQPQSRD